METLDSDTLPFARLRQYTIVRRIGSGPVGEVYEAVDPDLHRAVALKVLAAGPRHDADRMWRFYTQAAAAARLAHPNIVQIYFVGDDQGRCFYAMEYVAGGSLAALLERGERLSVARAIRMIGQMLTGLTALHYRKLIHGNIKPSNVLVDTVQGRVLLSDFGQSEAPCDSAQSPEAAQLTGALPADVQQRPEEQADMSVDLLAVGRIACRLLIEGGAAPEAQSPESLIFPADVPQELASLVRRLLSAKPGQPHEAAQAILDDLQPLLAATGLRTPGKAEPFTDATGASATGEGIRVPPASINRSTVIALPSFDVLPPLPDGLLGGGTQSWLERLNGKFRHWMHRNAPEFVAKLQSTQFQVDGIVLEYERRREWLRKLEHEAAAVLADMKEGVPSSAADAHDLPALIAGQERELEAIRQKLRALNARLMQLHSERDALRARLAVAAAQIRQHGGTPLDKRGRRIPVVELLLLAGFGGLAVFLYGNMALQALKRNFGQRGAFSSAPAGAGGAGAQSTWQIGSSNLRYLGRFATPPDLSWMPADRNARPVCRLECDTGMPHTIAFVPGRRLLVSAGLDGRARIWSTETGEEIKRYTCDKYQTAGGSVHPLLSLAVSRDGRTAALGAQLFTESLVLWNLVTGIEIRVMEGRTEDVQSLSFSPDGKTIAAVHRSSDIGGAISLRVWDASTGLPRAQLDTELLNIQQVLFNPTSPSIAVRDSKTADVVVFDAETGTRSRSFETHGIIPHSLAFSADGTRLAAGLVDGGALVWDTATGAELYNLRDKIGQHAVVALTADGQRLVAACSEAAAVWNLATGQVEQYLTGRFHAVACSDDNRTLATAGAPNRVLVWDLSSTAADLPDPNYARARHLASTYQFDSSELKKCLMSLDTGQPPVPMIAGGTSSEWIAVTLNTAGAGIDVVRLVSPLNVPGDLLLTLAEQGGPYDLNVVGIGNAVSPLFRPTIVSGCLVRDLGPHRAQSFSVQSAIGGEYAPRGEYLLWFLFDSKRPVELRFKVGFTPRIRPYSRGSLYSIQEVGQYLGIPEFVNHQGNSLSWLEPQEQRRQPVLELAPGFPVGENPLSR